MVFLISFVSSLASLGTFKQGECVRLIQTCDNCSYVNITSVMYPNSTIAVSNEAMTKVDTEYNYTFCNANYTGQYIVNTKGDPDGTTTASSYTFIVLPLGTQQTTAQGLNSIAFLLMMVFLTCFIAFVGFKFLEQDLLWPLGVFFIFLMFLFLIYDVWLGYEFHRNLAMMGSSAMPETIFWIFMFILVSSLLVSAILLFKHWKKIKQWFERAKEEERRSNEEDDRNWR